MAHYLLESACCLALLFCLYECLLRKESFFNLNRVYLLAIPLISFLIPALHFDWLQKPELTSGTAWTISNIANPVICQGSELNEIVLNTLDHQMPGFRLTWGSLLLGLYFAGVVWMLLRLARQLSKTIALIKRSPKNSTEGAVLVTVDPGIPVASFFGYIFWNHEDTSLQGDMILKHEIAHIRQWHSYDIILMEVIVALQWFNPLIRLYRQRLREVHEFIADAYVVQQSGKRYEYAQLLAMQTCRKGEHLVVNTFYSLIKTRLQMLSKSKSGSRQLLKYYLSLPLIILLTLSFSFDLIAIPAPVRVLDKYLESVAQMPFTSNIFQQPLPAEVLLTDVEKTDSLDNPVLYWGDLQVKYAEDDKKNHYSGAIETDKKGLKQFIYKMPFLFSYGSIVDSFKMLLQYKDFETQIIKKTELQVYPAHTSLYAVYLNEFLQMLEETISDRDEFTVQQNIQHQGENKFYSATITINSQVKTPTQVLEKDLSTLKPAMNFIWGPYINRLSSLTHNRITSEQLKATFQYEPELFDENGIQIPVLSMKLVCFRKNHDPFTIKIIADKNNPALYQISRRLVTDSLSANCKPGDLISLLDISSSSHSTLDGFSIGIELVEKGCDLGKGITFQWGDFKLDLDYDAVEKQFSNSEMRKISIVQIKRNIAQRFKLMSGNCTDEDFKVSVTMLDQQNGTSHCFLIDHEVDNWYLDGEDFHKQLLLVKPGDAITFGRFLKLFDRPEWNVKITLMVTE